MHATIQSLVTPGQIARELNEPLHRIRYILDTRQRIKAIRRIGAVRAYAGDAVDLVRAELQAIDVRRSQHKAPAA